MTRIMFSSSIAVAVVAVALLVRSEAGDKGATWQPLLSKQNYEVLVKREADLIRDLLGATPKDADFRRARLGAVMIAAMSKSSKDVVADDLLSTRSTALGLADLLRIDTTNPPGNELAAAKYVAAVLQKENIPV